MHGTSRLKGENNTQTSIAWVEKELGKCPGTEPPVGSLHYKPLNLGGKGESTEPYNNKSIVGINRINPIMLTHMKKDFISELVSQMRKDKKTCFSSFHFHSFYCSFCNSETYVVRLK